MSIRFDQSYLLHPDVKLIKVEDLTAEQRDIIHAKPNQVAITRRHSRSSAKLLDQRTAEIVSYFQAPIAIPDAIERFVRSTQEDWEKVTESAYPVLRSCIESGYLVLESEKEAGAVRYSLATDGEFLNYRVKRRVHLLSDTEIYLLSGADGKECILKLLRKGMHPVFRTRFAHEARVLRLLPPQLGPDLLEEGLVEDQSYLILQWLPGLPVLERASNLRRRGLYGHRDLLDLCLAILTAYARLHESGVVHGDVHPSNLICGKDEVRLIDFGFARILRERTAASRGGVAFYMEPEWAAALLEGRAAPSANVLGEQYAVGALLYQILCGRHRTQFVVVRDEMLRQLAFERPERIAAPVVEKWPDIESVVLRMLELDPGKRYPSMAAAAEGFAAGMEQTPVPHAPEFKIASVKFIDEFIAAAKQTVERGALIDAPLCSVMHGAAGIALSLHRIAGVRKDPTLFAYADLWAEQAVANTGQPNAFTVDGQLENAAIGEVTPFHTRSGLAFTAAVLAADRGDLAGFTRSVREFVRAIQAPCANMDLTLGKSGCLLAAAILLERAPIDADASREQLLSAGGSLSEEIVTWISGLAPMEIEEKVRYSGIAHGWSGILYALLAWSRVTNTGPGDIVRRRAQEFSTFGKSTGSGMRWACCPLHSVPVSFMPSWCNGNAGIAQFLVLAAEVLKDGHCLDLAIQTAENIWQEPSGLFGLCCGTAGQAYALLAVHQATGDPVWRTRAENLAELSRAGLGAKGAPMVWSLYKGHAGVSALLADLEEPRFAEMPAFSLLSR